MTTDRDHLTPTDPDYDALDDLLSILDLTPIDELGDERARALSEPGMLGAPFDEFVGRSQPQPAGRVFGGQVLAQSVVAAGRTVADVPGPARHLHSLHGYFLRSGDASRPLRFVVERLRDGHSFSQRRVHALQFDRPILSATFSFQTHSEGLDHGSVPPDVAAPETLPDVADLLADVPASREKSWVVKRAIDIRYPDGPLYLTPAPERAAHQSVWFRAVGALPDDPLIHQAVITYASDYTLLESILRRHGLAWRTAQLRAASLDHAMWFHRAGRADEWILYTQHSPSASGARGLGVGRMYTADGTHLATLAQEGMMRVSGV